MSEMDLSVKIKNYKCFRDEFTGFDKIMPVNIIIGRNNSGKSSLLDIIDFASNIDKTSNVVLQFTDIISDSELKAAFKSGTSGTTLYGDHWENHGRYLSGLCASYTIQNKNVTSCEWTNSELFESGLNRRGQSSREIRGRKEYAEKIIKSPTRTPSFFKNTIIRRILSERDISHESRNPNHLLLNPNGNGTTSVICRYINDADLDRRLITKVLLRALNQVFMPDNRFDEITVQYHEKREWEIHLYEQEKDLVPLSKSGSGLKTVLIVLLNLLVIPHSEIGTNEKPELEKYIFMFEELENNLHPALLRRLFKYIEDFAVKNKCHFFITTHSNVVIDMFSNSPNAQIVHVTHDGRQAYSRTIDSFDEHNLVLDDIGAKASDLLQANGIVWLEGPSDRIYFNKWIEFYSKGTLREHRDYECAFYGGSLLSHFDATDPSEECDAINLMRLNRNAILIGDSDRTSKYARLKSRLKKIKGAMEGIGGYVWVTKVKEIENYIPATVLEKIFGKEDLPEIEQYEYFYRKSRKTTKSKTKGGYWQQHKFTGQFKKVNLAEQVVQHLTKEMLDGKHDIAKEMKAICRKIEGWNKI